VTISLTTRHGPWARDLVAGIYLVIFLFLFLPAGPAGASTELEEIRRAIHEKGAHWTAGETSLTRLSPEERRGRLGSLGKPRKREDAHRSTPSLAAIAEIPSSFNWRDIGGRNFVTPIRDQSTCGACWAFAAAAAFESHILIEGDRSDEDLDLAEQILVSCSTAGTCAGPGALLLATFRGFAKRQQDEIPDR
jgi:hypothetical protein